MTDGEINDLHTRLIHLEARFEARVGGLEKALADHRSESKIDRKELSDAFKSEVLAIRKSITEERRAHHAELVEALSPFLKRLDLLTGEVAELKASQTRWRGWVAGVVSVAVVVATVVQWVLPHLLK